MFLTHKLAIPVRCYILFCLLWVGCSKRASSSLEERDAVAVASGQQNPDSINTSSSGLPPQLDSPAGLIPQPTQPTTSNTSIQEPLDEVDAGIDRNSAGEIGQGFAPVSNEMNSAESASNSTPIETIQTQGLQAPNEAQTISWSTKEWVLYIAQIDKAFQALMSDRDTYRVSMSGFSAQATRLAELKLAASDRLMSLGDEILNRELGILGKMEALSMMAGMGERNRAAELLEFAKQNTTFQSKEVARQAALVLLGFSINGLGNGSVQPDTIIAQVDAVLSDKGSLRMRDFKMMEQVVSVLLRYSFPDAAREVTRKTIAAFETNSDPEIGYTVWQLAMKEDAQFQSLSSAIKDGSTAPGRLSNLLNDYFDSRLSDWSIYWVANEIRNLEFLGNHDGAAIIGDFVQRNLDKIKSEQIREVVKIELDALILHRQMVGQQFLPSELQNMQGQAFDIKSLNGKVVLVVYWSSWCTACRGEIPELKELYSAFQPKGLEILFINLDESPAAMTGFVQAFQVPGIHLRSSKPTLVGVNTPAARQVQLRATPFNLILNRNGIISAMQIHGPKLREQLETLFKESASN